MASAKPSPKKLNCKIKDIQPDPLHVGRMIVSVEFDDGNKAGPWHQGFSVIPESVINIEDFLTQLYTQEIHRPVDPYTNLRQALQTGETFVLDLTAKIESSSDN